ncbi:MAG: VOC family protein [Longimicrobiales bacterium]|nr:VOC family protein [Longimicrobiales bacterium]
MDPSPGTERLDRRKRGPVKPRDTAIPSTGAATSGTTSRRIPHPVGLNTWESADGPPSPGTTGLHHVAFRYASGQEPGGPLRRLRRHGIPLEGAADHGVSEALCLRDPDGNGLELYRDRPRAVWPTTDAHGRSAMYTGPSIREELSRA